MIAIKTKTGKSGSCNTYKARWVAEYSQKGGNSEVVEKNRVGDVTPSLSVNNNFYII